MAVPECTVLKLSTGGIENIRKKTLRVFIPALVLDRTINVKASCKVHRAVYDRLSELLEQLNRLKTSSEIDDELMDNISLVLKLIDGLYLKGKSQN